ncbi:MAG TPA: DUF1049 domain-containing protein [Peptococcaceae bacterium]|nr:DUF1049 domain-containing protein [Peptococcaceae bacterium]
MFVLMISIVIALIIVIFAVQNAAVVPVQFLSWSTELPLVLVIFCAVFAGALLMFCLALWRELKHQIGKRPKLELKTNKEKKGKILETKKAEDNGPIDIASIKQSLADNQAEEQSAKEKKAE